MNPLIDYCQYECLLSNIVEFGVEKTDRTGTGTRSIFGPQMRFNLADGFPLITTKKIHFKSVAEELLWFLSGSTNNNDLNARGCKIWDEWAGENGSLGPIYGHQMRNWGGQIPHIRQPKPSLRAGVSATYLDVGNGAGKNNHPLGKTWEGMMSRCYDPDSIGYENYGGRGVYVCDRWLEFAAFAEDASSLPGWNEKQTSDKRYVLDKDFIGGGFEYGPRSCMWMTDKENINVSADTIYTVARGGKTFDFFNISDFCKEHGVEAANFSDLWTGNKNAKVRNGFTYVGKRPRRPGIDQIQAAVDLIKRDPDSRRIIVSAWNVGDLDKMALSPCHALFQFYVADGRLSCQLYQRSADIFLGVPFNIASYALLTEMMAHQCDLLPGEFVWTGGDTHLYSNHVEQAALQLSRTPRPYPKLSFARKPESLFDYNFEDFIIEGYDPDPAIKAPVAV